MKTLMIISAALVLALSCVKTEPALQDSQTRIVFSEPVMGVSAKSPIDGDYPTSGVFRVWGFFSLNKDVIPVDGQYGIGYIDGALCRKEGDVWVPYYSYTDENEQTRTGYYYWKAGAGYMTFHALSPSTVTGVTHNWQTGFSIKDYTIADTPPEDEDLLFSSYTSPSACNAAGVDITFHHALSKVHFIVREAADYSGDQLIKVKKLELLDVYRKADFAENRPTGSLESAYTGAAAAWTMDTSSEHDYVLYNGDPVTLTWNAGAAVDAPLGISARLFLPQSLDHGADGNGKVAVRVTYTLGTSDTELTVSGTLSGAGSITQWVRGHSYTYVVLVGKHKITFSPEVEDWTEDEGWILVR